MIYHKLKVIKYRFTLEAIDNISLPAYKGSTFHGGFGHALMKISPTWYRYFYEPSLNNNPLPKPFVLLPPLDELEHYPKGHQFSLELTLIGDATQHHAIAQAAIEYLGLQMGLGYEQGKYKIIDIQQSQTPQQLPQQKTPQTIKQLTLHFPTRLRIKANNRLQKQAPSFELLITRLIGRIKTLETAYGQDTENNNDDTNSNKNHLELIKKVKQIKIQNSQIKWDDWDRFSGSQKKWMKFGGLIGKISYIGDITEFMPILELGEWLHIGNKTSFGLGKYQIKKY